MPDRRSRKYGVKKRGEKWVARPYIAGVGHVWVGTFDIEDEALRAAIEKFDELSRLPSTKETIQTFADRWIRDYPRPKQSTNDHYHGHAKMLAKEHGSKRVRDFGRLDARRFAKAHPGAARSCRAMFSDMMDEGLIEINQFAKLGITNSRGRKDINVLSVDELDRLLALAESCHPKYKFAPMLAFSASSTMRPGEVFGLEWDDIDFEHDEIHVKRQLHKGRCTTPKNGMDRKIVLPPAAAEALRSLSRFTPIIMADETGKERPINLVFRNKSGDPMSQTTLHFYWNPVRAAFGRPEMDYYELRHFGATFLLEMFRANGEEGSYDVAVQLGHTDDGELVRDLYGHPSDDLSRERLKRLFQRNVEPLRAVEDDEEAANG